MATQWDTGGQLGVFAPIKPPWAPLRAKQWDTMGQLGVVVPV